MRRIFQDGYLPVAQLLEREMTSRTGVSFGSPNVTEMTLDADGCTIVVA